MLARAKRVGVSVVRARERVCTVCLRASTRVRFTCCEVLGRGVGRSMQQASRRVASRRVASRRVASCGGAVRGVTQCAVQVVVTKHAAHAVVTQRAAHVAVTQHAVHVVVTQCAAHVAVTQHAAHVVVTQCAAHVVVTQHALHAPQCRTDPSSPTDQLSGGNRKPRVQKT
jgi:hypothetical protein